MNWCLVFLLTLSMAVYEWYNYGAPIRIGPTSECVKNLESWSQSEINQSLSNLKTGFFSLQISLWALSWPIIASWHIIITFIIIQKPVFQMITLLVFDRTFLLTFKIQRMYPSLYYCVVITPLSTIIIFLFKNHWPLISLCISLPLE